MITSKAGFALFDTAIGRCAIAWRGGRVCGTMLPEPDDGVMRARLERRFPDSAEAEPPSFAAAAIAAIRMLIDGGADALAAVEVDLTGASDFDAAVYAAVRRIPRGQVRSYGDIAREVGAPQASQAVGIALARNPVPLIVPCHRVLGSGGRSGGFSAPGGVATKFRLLETEGARRPGDPELFESLPLAVKPT